jgi:hypothetical protein
MKFCWSPTYAEAIKYSLSSQSEGKEERALRVEEEKEERRDEEFSPMLYHNYQSFPLLVSSFGEELEILHMPRRSSAPAVMIPVRFVRNSSARQRTRCSGAPNR